MPRRVTPLQSSQLRKILSDSHPGISVDVISNPGDPEALEYAAQLMNALHGIGEWDSEMVTVDPWGTDRSDLLEKHHLNNAYMHMATGLVVQDCSPAIGYDPKHPPAASLLTQALSKAQIEVNGGTSSSGCTQYSVALVVAPRPLKIGQQEPVLAKIARWLQRKAYEQ